MCLTLILWANSMSWAVGFAFCFGQENETVRIVSGKGTVTLHCSYGG